MQEIQIKVYITIYCSGLCTVFLSQLDHWQQPFIAQKTFTTVSSGLQNNLYMLFDFFYFFGSHMVTHDTTTTTTNIIKADS